jgi:hypothetical protein
MKACASDGKDKGNSGGDANNWITARGAPPPRRIMYER